MSSILERNLLALGIASGQAARSIHQSTARTDVRFFHAEDGALSASIGEEPAARLLASRRRPLDEARVLAQAIDPREAALVLVQGFGLGHHVRLLAQRLGPTSAVFVYEPDVGLLRSVLERIDHSGWLGAARIRILTDAEDGGAVAAAIRGCEGLIGLGVRILAHPASLARLGAGAARMESEFVKVVSAAKTSVVTTLAQSQVTLTNVLLSMDRYITCPGLADLSDAARGKPAIVVAAGPSLRRNIELLSRPGVRDRFVVIAVQTVLKQLLARGIRPHFVTALDYHEISRRFYEGLSRNDVEGVTLVVESQAHPAILAAFPGAVRMPRRKLAESIAGPGLDASSDPRYDALCRGLNATPDLFAGELTPGATVAHMAYYLARHLGCDPVIMLGQDLGFTDGQYYAAGAAIHDVWSGELNAFNTLEMMEWQRIVRNRPTLRRAVDVLGRPIYTDEQMAAYLVQFERDFKADHDRGLTIIDATEGGVAKQHATPVPLAQAIERFGAGEPVRLPAARPEPESAPRIRRLDDRLRRLRQDVQTIAQRSRRTLSLLEQMLDCQRDQRKVVQLIRKVEALRDEVTSLAPAYALVDHINQTGALKRIRADRELALEPGLAPLERQRRQIERDIVNVRWFAEAGDQLGSVFDASIRSLQPSLQIVPPPTQADQPRTSDATGPGRVFALIPVDAGVCGLGTPRRLDESFHAENPLRLTLRRLARARELAGVILLTSQPEEVSELAGAIPGLNIEIVRTQRSPLAERAAAIRAGRLWARSCWRGGLAGLTIYDEALAPHEMARVMDERGIAAAAIVGADWCCIDPRLVDAAIERFRQPTPGSGPHRVTFVQAPPGLGTAVIERTLMRELADKAAKVGTLATIGAMLGYIPVAPVADPIARSACIPTDPLIRDAQFRFIPDSAPRRAALARALATLQDLSAASAADIAQRIREHQALPPPGPPQELILEICTGRRASGPRGVWMRGCADSVERPILSIAAAERILAQLGEAREDAALTLAGAGDPLNHPDLFRIIAIARRCGIAGIHIRTDLVCEAALVDRLLDADIDVLSVDLMAESADVYRRLMGADLFARARSNLERLILARQQRPAPDGLPTPWIVPRITRCDATYEHIEPFFDRWTLGAGCAVIDPLPLPIPGDRIEPLPIPGPASLRMARERMVVLSDGRVPAGQGSGPGGSVPEYDLSGERCIGDVLREGLMPVWRRMVTRRYELLVEPRTEPALHGGATRARVASLTAGM